MNNEKIVFTKDDFEKYQMLHEIFMEKLEEVLNLKVQIETGKKGYDGDIENIEFEGGKIYVTTEWSSCSCCPSEQEYYSIPEHYIYDENWQEECRKKVEEKKEKERKEKEKRDLKTKQVEEEWERKKYEELKKKFEE